MNDLTACCGLDCGTCEARLATIRRDDALRARVAARWSALNHAEITPGMIDCTGCRLPGPKTPYAATLCPVRRCARSRRLPTCAPCPDLPSCPKIAPLAANNPAILRNLRP